MCPVRSLFKPRTAPSIYRHTQFGAAFVATLSLGVAAILWRGFSAGWDPVLALVLASLLLCLLLFSTLTVTVGQGRLSLCFGPGFHCRSYALSRIRSVSIVRSKWWHGFGIRWIPGGVLYSVSGLDAVELTLTSGRTIRIGTDEPQALAGAVRKAMQE